jgi:ATP-dependent Lon protease
MSGKKTIEVTPENCRDFLGVPRYRYGEAELEDQVGVVTGLAWTEVGGELLTIEGVMMPGKGKMTVTGNLRDVMKESISAAAPMCAPARRFRHRAADFRQADIPRPRAGRRDAEGRSVGRHRHGHGHVSVLTGIPVRRMSP